MEVLSAREERLLGTLRGLPESITEQLLGWVENLASLAQGRPVEYSDTWTDGDVREVTAYSLANFECDEEIAG